MCIYIHEFGASTLKKETKTCIFRGTALLMDPTPKDVESTVPPTIQAAIYLLMNQYLQPWALQYKNWCLDALGTWQISFLKKKCATFWPPR